MSVTGPSSHGPAAKGCGAGSVALPFGQNCARKRHQPGAHSAARIAPGVVRPPRIDEEIGLGRSPASLPTNDAQARGREEPTIVAAVGAARFPGRDPVGSGRR